MDQDNRTDATLCWIITVCCALRQSSRRLGLPSWLAQFLSRSATGTLQCRRPFRECVRTGNGHDWQSNASGVERQRSFRRLADELTVFADCGRRHDPDVWQRQWCRTMSVSRMMLQVELIKQLLQELCLCGPV